MRSIIFMVLVSVLCGFKTSADLNANDVLKRMADQLNRIGTLQYDYTRNISYPSESYKASTSGHLFLDFTSKDTVLGFKYQINDGAYSNIFNGTEQFDLNKKDKTMALANRPAIKNFRSISYFYNSIVTLKRILPAIIADETIGKSLTENDTSYIVQLSLHKRMLNYLDGFSTLTTDRTIHYSILIDKATLLPRRIIQTNNVNDDRVQTDFTRIEAGAPYPPDVSWYYSSYTKEYRMRETNPAVPVMLYTAAPDFKLPVLGISDSLSLHQLKGEIVLLEFWIKNCGYCIEAVPILNNYKNVFAINVNNTKEDMARFAERNKVAYKILYNGETVAWKYGIPGYPMLVIIGKTGKVIYTGAVNKAAIDEVLKKEEAGVFSR